MKLTRISDEEIVDAYVSNGIVDRIIAHNYLAEGDTAANAQLAHSQKQHDEYIRGLFDWLEKYHTDAPFHNFTVYLTEDEWQSLKEQYLK
jgi:hypothetical protein